MQFEELESKLRAYEESRVLLTAIELNVFTSVEGGATAKEAAGRLNTEPRATEILLNALVSLGMLHKREGRFGNEPLAARFLVDGSPENSRAGMMHTAHRWHTWSKLTSRVRGDAMAEEYRKLDSERHEALLARLHRRAAKRAPRLVAAIGTHGVRRLLDVGGGSAAYSITFAKASPEIEAEAFDLPEVIPITERYIAAAGLTERVRARAGDLLEDEFGSGYDLILLFSVAHLLGESENRSLLERCHRALAPGGRVAIHDHILDSDKTGPRTGAIFALNMLLVTPRGGTYSYEEYDRWLRDAGFSAVERIEIGEPTGIVIGSR
jgi:SAM-dependent methyltransferase